MKQKRSVKTKLNKIKRLFSSFNQETAVFKLKDFSEDENRMFIRIGIIPGIIFFQTQLKDNISGLLKFLDLDDKSLKKVLQRGDFVRKKLTQEEITKSIKCYRSQAPIFHKKLVDILSQINQELML